MKTKICKKCGEEKFLSEFYTHKGMSDGYFNICKECTKQRVANYRIENIEKIREYDRNRPNKYERYEINRRYFQKNKEKIKSYKKIWNDKNKNKRNAEQQARRAILAGKITKPPKCEICGKITENLEAHHKDYTKPLEVEFLCIECHKKEHKKINEQKRNENELCCNKFEKTN